ncbi:hypothetical protein MTR_4g098770 [Medicago truncatula]|uniref:Uncharacterized protein n=1 Tax=Medicago truncatula TaxID=3880 RepID=G7JHM2_MEDTR|nr:hypothetical protein MTR_4g098770 [Medicago truncatula]
MVSEPLQYPLGHLPSGFRYRTTHHLCPQTKPNSLKVDFDATKEVISPCNYYRDTPYLLSYSTFVKLPYETTENSSEISSTISTETEVNGRSEVDSKSANTYTSDEKKKTKACRIQGPPTDSRTKSKE